MGEKGHMPYERERDVCDMRGGEGRDICNMQGKGIYSMRRGKRCMQHEWVKRGICHMRGKGMYVI